MKNERGGTMFEHKTTLPNALHRPTFASLLQQPHDNSQTTPPFSLPPTHDDYYYYHYSSDHRTSTSSTASPTGDASPYSSMSPYLKSPWLVPNSPMTTPLYNSPSFAKRSFVGSLVRKEGHMYSLAAYGGLLYTGSDSKNIRVWKNMKEFSGFKSNSGLVKAIAITSKGLIFTGHQDGKIRIWKNSSKDPGVHKRVGSLPTTKDYLISSINPNNYVEVRRRVKVLRIKHFDAVSCLALNDELGLLYSGSWDRTMKVWRLSDFKCLESVHAHDDALNAIASGFDGMVFTGSADGMVKVWRRELVGSSTRHVMVQMLLEQDCAVTSLAVDHQSRVVYCGSSDGLVNVWECEKQFSHCGTLRGHSLAVLCLAATNIGGGEGDIGGGLLFSGGADKSIRVWRRDGAGVHYCMSVFTGHAGPIKCLAVEEREATEDSGREWRLYSGSLDKSVKVWRVMEHPRDGDGNLSDWFARMDLAADAGGVRFSPLRAGDHVRKGADVDTPYDWNVSKEAT